MHVLVVDRGVVEVRPGGLLEGEEVLQRAEAPLEQPLGLILLGRDQPDDVLVEYRDGDKRLAPFVAPRKGGVTILRKGYTMERYTPPYIAPKRTLTADDLSKKGFGEARDILDGLGVFNGAVEADVTKTRELVLQGYDRFMLDRLPSSDQQL